ncbi:MAG: transcription termination factor NusA [Brevefilum sp.]|jgi:N utilization substance protein A
MKSEFALAFNELVEDKQLSRDIIQEALESAMISAYRRTVNASSAQYIEARIDMDSGDVSIFAEKEVVDEVQNKNTEVLLDEAARIDEEAELGDMVVVDSTPEDFGRVAAQTARQVIQQRIREAEREIQFDYFDKQVGEIVSGVVQAVNSQRATIGLDKKAEGVMLRKDMIPRERLRVHDRIRCLIYDVKDSGRGPQILLSRAHRNFLRRLLENEVPEIYHGIVEIRSIAREPGQRAKVAVSATQQGIDPVGACVGVRGVRIQAIVRELSDEKIDVIEWSDDAEAFIAKAISPARVLGVYLAEFDEEGKTATVVVPEDQLSLAIGRDGQNARLAAKLTGWRIDIKNLVEAADDALVKLQEDPAYAEMAVREEEAVEKISVMLEKKAEGRPLPPEDYDFMAKFIDRVERRLQKQRREEDLEAKRRRDEALATVPELSFEIDILDVDLPDHILYILQEGGFDTLGDLVLQMRVDPDRILALNGIGPKSFEQITELTDNLRVEPTIEEEEILEVETETVEAEAGILPEIEEAVVEIPSVEVEGVAVIEAVEEKEPEVVEEEHVKEPEKVEEEEEDFDKLFSYDARKYGYFEHEKMKPEQEEDIQQKPVSKKKKRKRPRSIEDEDNEWENW